MSYVVNDVDGDDLVAFVRLAEGGTVKLHSGDTVPAHADPDHVAVLLDRGVLAATGDSTLPTTVDAILAVVGDDPDKAQRYLDEERAAAKPRKTLIDALVDVVTGAAS